MVNKLVNSVDDWEGNDTRVLVSPDVSKRTVEVVDEPSIHR